MAAVAEREQINQNVEEMEVQAGPYPIDTLVVSVEIIASIPATAHSCPDADLPCFSLHFFIATGGGNRSCRYQEAERRR